MEVRTTLITPVLPLETVPVATAPITESITRASMGTLAAPAIIAATTSVAETKTIVRTVTVSTPASIAETAPITTTLTDVNRETAKKLAEEYHHKASIAAAMTGYRELYGLEHKDAEYMELFNSLKEQLNTNPSKGIDTFLKLKSPHEELSDGVKNLLKPENLKVIAEEVNELIKKKP